MAHICKAVISLGSNTENSHANVLAAIARLSGILASSEASEAYFTAPLSGNGSDYCNAVLTGYTSLSEPDLNALLKKMEEEAGRDENARARGDVPLDLDLVIMDGKVLRAKDAEREYFLRGYRQLLTAHAVE